MSCVFFQFINWQCAANATLYVIFNAIDRLSLTSIYLKFKQDLPYDWNGLKLLSDVQSAWLAFLLCAGENDASYGMQRTKQAKKKKARVVDIKRKCWNYNIYKGTFQDALHNEF